MFNILFITENLNYADGVTTHLYNLTSELSKNENFSLNILTSGGDSTDRFGKLGIKIIEDRVFNHQNRSLKNFSLAIKRLTKISNENGINIIHSHNHYAANISYYASKFSGIKTVQTIHGMIPEGGYLKHFRADKYITVNKPLEKFLINNVKLKKENIRFINQGFRFNKNIFKRSSGEIKIICASRLIYDKGVDIFIKASKIVKSKFDGEVEFLVAGEGECGNELRKLCKNINADVTFLGTVKNIPELFSSTDIFVMPSRATEGFPMTIVEAAFTKNLIITSEFKDFEKILTNDDDIYTFEMEDYEGLAGKIMAALENPVRSVEMAESFHSKSKKQFDINIMAQKHIEVYSECQKV